MGRCSEDGDIVEKERVLPAWEKQEKLPRALVDCCYG